MQLGELQSQLDRFSRRQVSVLALSVDPAKESTSMVDRLGLDYVVASDQNQRVIQLFNVQNPDTQELALHAVYIIDSQSNIYYRKVGLRRPISAELIDAIDAHRGTYPQHDLADQPRQRITVAFPQNNFQALLALSNTVPLPNSVDAQGVENVMNIIRTGSGDDAVFAFRRMINASPRATEQDLINAAIWMTRTLLFTDKDEVILAGQQLRRQLDRVRQLEQAVDRDTSSDLANRDKFDPKLEENLAKARARLSVIRRNIQKNAVNWQLRQAKTTLRVYRELARAARS